MTWLDKNVPDCKDRTTCLLWNNESVICSREVLYLKEWAVNVIFLVSDFVTLTTHTHTRTHARAV